MTDKNKWNNALIKGQDMDLQKSIVSSILLSHKDNKTIKWHIYWEGKLGNPALPNLPSKAFKRIYHHL